MQASPYNQLTRQESTFLLQAVELAGLKNWEPNSDYSYDYTDAGCNFDSAQKKCWVDYRGFSDDRWCDSRCSVAPLNSFKEAYNAETKSLTPSFLSSIGQCLKRDPCL